MYVNISNLYTPTTYISVLLDMIGWSFSLKVDHPNNLSNFKYYYISSQIFQSVGFSNVWECKNITHPLPHLYLLCILYDVLVCFFVILFNFLFLFCRTVDRLWSITEDLNILYKENWTRLAAQEVQQFQVSNIMCVWKKSVCSLCLYTINLPFSPS